MSKAAQTLAAPQSSAERSTSREESADKEKTHERQSRAAANEMVPDVREARTREQEGSTSHESQNKKRSSCRHQEKKTDPHSVEASPKRKTVRIAEFKIVGRLPRASKRNQSTEHVKGSSVRK